MSKSETKRPVLPVLAPVMKGKAAPHMDAIRELCTGDGGSVPQLCAALSLSDRDARNVIDAIRRKEGKGAIVNVYSEKQGHKVFRYLGADGKGFPARAKADA